MPLLKAALLLAFFILLPVFLVGMGLGMFGLQSFLPAFFRSFLVILGCVMGIGFCNTALSLRIERKREELLETEAWTQAKSEISHECLKTLFLEEKIPFTGPVKARRDTRGLISFSREPVRSRLLGRSIAVSRDAHTQLRQKVDGILANHFTRSELKALTRPGADLRFGLGNLTTSHQLMEALTSPQAVR